MDRAYKWKINSIYKWKTYIIDHITHKNYKKKKLNEKKKMRI